MNSDTRKLLLIDGMNIVRRVFEANPDQNMSTKVEGAMRSSLGSFRRALKTHEPTHAMAAFDHGGKTWRHDLYEGYRAKRKPAPQELLDAIPSFMEQLSAEFGLRSCSVPGVEADDVLAMMARTWIGADAGPVVVLSTDKDLVQLVPDGARVYDHFREIWHDDAWSTAKFGVPCSQLGDLLAMAGDGSDDVPGVPGIGEKTAAKLLKTHGTLDAIIESAPRIMGKVGHRLCENVEILRISRRLIDFKTDIELGITAADLRLAA